MSDFIEEISKSKLKSMFGIKEKYPNKYLEILEYNINFNNITWGQKLYNYVNGIHEQPKCIKEGCNNDVKFHKASFGYKKYCSSTCMYSDVNYKKKKKEGFIKSLGVDNPLKSKDVQKKRRILCLEKYGVEHHSKLSTVIEKKKQTNLKKWGVTTNLLHQDTIDKSKKTTFIKFGVKHNSQSEIIKEKKKQTNLKKRGVEYNFQSEDNRKKSKKTNLIKYGVEFTTQSKLIRDKQQKTKRINNIKIIANQLKIAFDNIKFINNEYYIYNYCNKHHVFQISPNLLHQRWFKYNKNICTICNPINKHVSIKENEIRNFIENELNIKTQKIRINNKEIDIYLPDNKLGIEFNGLYWHSDFFKDKNYHFDKTELCEKNDIQLLHVFEDEWIYKKEIVKSIVKSKLGIIENKIFGRKTEIKEINDNKLIRKFLEVNHIQGFVGSSVKLGLFYENELVSIMTFGKKRIAMGNKRHIEGEYEMLRFCNKLNTTIIGGASKLLKYFIKNYQPKSIISFADRRYSQGKLYEKLGFKFIGNTKPNYWYFNKNDLIRYHRFGFRKDVLVKEGYTSNKTEKKIMNERDYYCIYDCGNIKFELTI